MHRLPSSTEQLRLERVVLSGDAARHLKVLRPKPGEEIELFDGRGKLRRYRFASGALEARGDVADVPPPAFRLVLFACVTKGSRWDWTIEKAVELGVSQIVPVLSERCIVRLDARERAAKRERWMRIAEDAARQSDAAWLPDVSAAVDFPEALARVRDGVRTFAGALTDPPSEPILSALAKRPVAPGEALGVFTGPEGDFTPAELAALLEVAEPVNFGPTVLRAETAAIFGLSALAAAAHAAAGAGVLTRGGAT
ncbi:MAG: 16S rRNA (uracil(1498)-N(3))-methyltransferase [Kiritimatiellae bacterium]|nr:16S rRNA (uracil(1498)-N(3))-methyltransferase [Kiritimatiellia bacterium]